MLPPFNERGNLPPGIYEITWTELKNRFGFNSHRQSILIGLQAVLQLLGKANCQMLINMVSLFWASMAFTLVFRALKPYLGKHKWAIAAYHALLFAFVTKPVFAQAADAGAVCTNTGLFSQVTNFINTVFANITFGGVAAGSLSALICQVVGLLTVGLLLGFLGVLGTVSYQVGYQRQPIATVLDPVFGFLIFAGGATFVTTIMLGTAG